ncbi:MAG: hypothetical protein U0324_38190 [Polyangiales bacterium]
MGQLDQLAKRILREETRDATRHHVSFEVPPEVPVGALAPDGVVRVVQATGLSTLPAPWCRLRTEATLDVKMPGDHCDRPALVRNELRRLARWVRLLEDLRDQARETGGPLEVRDPREDAAWLVAPALARWVREDAAAGFFAIEAAAPGCWRLALGLHETLWIAANELPLRVELIPFLVARSGAALAEFLAWSVTVKGPAWTWAVVKEMPMSPETADGYVYVPDDPEEQYRIKTRYTKRLLEAYPEAANDILQHAREEGIKEGIKEGVDAGRLAALRHAVLAVLTARGIAVDDAARARVEAANDAAVLDRWLAAAATAATAGDALR